MYCFNPEHDICLANGDANFSPPESSLRFGRDCAGIMRFMDDDESGAGVIAWGWDKVLKTRLLREGVDESLLPYDACLEGIRELSHRRVALECNAFLHKCPTLSAPPVPVELKSLAQVNAFLARQERAVLKAPWSGSGKGLRWISDGLLSSNDEGWCRNVFAKQGCIIGESREDVVLDFALLYKVSGTASCPSLTFEGYSLFETCNGAYTASVLASDGHIRDVISGYISLNVFDDVKLSLESFLSDRFCGSYRGFLGVDMFVCRSGVSYLLNPCVEINVRMTMGLLARRYYDRHFAHAHPREDGLHRLSVIYSAKPSALQERLKDALEVLTCPGPEGEYAVAVY
ncbi:MAG: hypothetical protein ACI395_00095 [Candidatus Cryptobacteroides sp.]